jgi:L-amino acid N-acyltransferase YncA
MTAKIGAANIRDAHDADMASVQAIYAHHVLHGLATFEETPPSVAEMIARRLKIYQQRLPYIVAECDGEIVGYAYASAFRPRPAYRYTVEDSIYVRHDLTGRGIGAKLLAELISCCEAGGFRQMIAVIGDSDNLASIGLHERFGFRRTNLAQAVGFKFGRWVDTVDMQRALGPGDSTLPAEAAG